MILPYIEVTQPIGTFYITKMKASDLVQKTTVNRRIDDLSGIQRELSQRRVKEISKFCEDPDAVFPTAIIVSVYNSGDFVSISDNCFNVDDSISIIGEVIDGQHRLNGIKASGAFDDYELPVVLLFDLDPEDKAYIFSIINSKQTTVSSSLIYDLFDLSSYRTPQKFVHDLARSFNETPESPLYGRIKMLGKKRDDQDDAVISQGSFASFIIELITKDAASDAANVKRGQDLNDNPDCPLRRCFIDKEDGIILKILINYFTALKDVFYNEWKFPKTNILWKTSGFGGVVKAFPILYQEGIKRGDLSQKYFCHCFEQFKARLQEKNITLTKDNFPGGGAGVQNKIRDLVIGRQ